MFQFPRGRETKLRRNQMKLRGSDSPSRGEYKIATWGFSSFPRGYSEVVLDRAASFSDAFIFELGGGGGAYALFR